MAPARVGLTAARAEANRIHRIMRREPVESSSIASVGYDQSTATLEVAFREGGVYRYFQVPARVHADLLAADSAGTYFVRNIRPVYPFERVD